MNRSWKSWLHLIDSPADDWLRMAARKPCLSDALSVSSFHSTLLRLDGEPKPFLSDTSNAYGRYPLPPECPAKGSA
jgi:hypothetical protein